MSDPIWEIPFLGIVRCTITETEWRWEQIRPDAKMPQFRAADPLSALCIPSLRLDQPLHPDELSLLDFIETQEITYPVSASPFRQHVWEAMTTIPWESLRLMEPSLSKLVFAEPIRLWGLLSEQIPSLSRSLAIVSCLQMVAWGTLLWALHGKPPSCFGRDGCLLFANSPLSL